MRSWFRHEQQSIRMALASVLHHSYDRVHTEYGAPHNQTTATRARRGRESYETKIHGEDPEDSPSQAFFQLYDEEDAERGVRPGSVMDPVPQGRVQRHTVEHRIDACPFVQILDAPVPQVGDHVLELLQKIVTASLVEPVQVIAVPKIYLDRSPLRSAVRRTQMAEQLVEVPTEPGYVLAVLASKFYSRRELRGFLSGQGSTASIVEQNVDIPVPQVGGGRGGPQGFLLGQDSTAFCGADGDENPVPRRDRLQVLHPRTCLVLRMRLLLFFSHFSPNKKKVWGWARTRGRNWVRTLIHGLRRLMPTP